MSLVASQSMQWSVPQIWSPTLSRNELGLSARCISIDGGDKPPMEIQRHRSDMDWNV
jgi:hypothetical protein